MKTMYSAGYHQNGFVASYTLRHISMYILCPSARVPSRPLW